MKSVPSLDNLKPLEIWMAPHGVKMLSAHTEWQDHLLFKDTTHALSVYALPGSSLVVWGSKIFNPKIRRSCIRIVSVVFQVKVERPVHRMP